MGHLKRIGKKECCDDCTDGKCDDCGPCDIFEQKAFCGSTTENICKRGWGDYNCTLTDTNGVEYDPSGDLDPCRRWHSRSGSASADYCADSGQSTREEVGYFNDSSNKDSSCPTEAWNDNSVNPDNRSTWSSDSLSACFEEESFFSTDNGNPWGLHSVKQVDEYTRTYVEFQYEDVSAFGGSGGGTGQEGLSDEVSWQDALEEAVSIVECDREDCVVASVGTEAERLALTGLSVGDIVVQTHDENGDPHCGDGMHYSYLGGGEDQAENWDQLGVLFQCPYLSDTPEGCIEPVTGLFTWLVNDGSEPRCFDESLTSVSTCFSGTTQYRTARFSLALKGLEVGTAYVLTLTYRKCTFPEGVLPDCLSGKGFDCVEVADQEGEVQWEEETREIEFTATHWGEVLSNDCTSLESRVKLCRLQEEADNLNDGDGGTRDATCTETDLQVPMEYNRYFEFAGCGLTVKQESV